MSVPRNRRRAIHVTDVTYDALNATASAMDVDTAVLIVGLIDGAIRLGQVERLATAGLTGRTLRRRARESLPWRSVAGATFGTQEGPVPARWVMGAWTLERRGRAGPHPKPGEGWWLTGPCLDEPRFVGLRTQTAKDEAGSIIRRLERGCGDPTRACPLRTDCTLIVGHEPPCVDVVGSPHPQPDDETG